MNKKIITFIVATAFISGVAVATALNAQTKTTFSQANASTITAVDTNAHTITVSYVQPLSACSPTYCLSGRSPDVLREGEVMAINVMDQVENDFTKMKVGDSVTVYFRQDGAASIPYAVKDFTLVPPGCDPITKICSASGTITPGSGGGSGGSGTGTITPIKPSPVSVPTITQDLSVGVSSEQVSALQLKLQSLGYFPSSLQPTGYFGSVTKKAVIDFQAAQGLPTTGYVGPMTRSALGTKLVQGSNLADLTIDSISFKRYQPPPPGPGEPQGVVSMDNAFEFTVRVKNIGDASFNQSFYLENTRSSYDLSIGHYSHGELVNQQRTVLNPNGTMEIKIIDSIDANVHKVGFLIATDGKAHLKGAFPKIEEKDYSNNSYELQIP